jgi:hypothetical protein
LKSTRTKIQQTKIAVRLQSPASRTFRKLRPSSILRPCSSIQTNGFPCAREAPKLFEATPLQRPKDGTHRELKEYQAGGDERPVMRVSERAFLAQ